MENISSQPPTGAVKPPTGGVNPSQWDGIPSKVVAKTGDLGIKQIKKEISINDRSQIAFVGSGFEETWSVVTHVSKDGIKTAVKQDHVFSFDNEKDQLRDLSANVILATAANPEYGIARPNAINALTPLIKNPARTFDIFKTSYISPGFDASERSSGIQINNSGDILVRRLEVSSGWTFLGLKEDFGVYPFHYWTPEPNKYASFVETWSANNSSNFQSPKLISQGFITSYLFPDTYSPVPRLPLIPLKTYEPDFAAHANNASINNKGDIVFRAFGPDNWIAIHDPNNPIIRPQSKDPDMLKVKVPDLGFNVWSSDDDLFIRSSQTSVEAFDKSFKFTPISDSSFTRTGNKARISDDGNVIAFYGERTKTLPSGVQGPPELEKGIYIAIRRKKPDTWEVINVAMAGGEIIDFEPDSPVGVTTHSFTDDRGTVILGATVVYTGSTSEGEKLYSNRISFDLRENFSGSASYEHVHKPKVVASGFDEIEIYDPINSKGQISYWTKKGNEESVQISEGGFDIDLRFGDPKDFSDAIRQDIFDAIDKWETVIVGDLPGEQGVDDFVLNVAQNKVDSLETPSVIAEANTAMLRQGSGLPYTGIMYLSYHLKSLVENPLQYIPNSGITPTLVAHELGHALGFVGIPRRNAVQSADGKPLLIDGNALRQYREIFGDIEALPMYTDTGLHWYMGDARYAYPSLADPKVSPGLGNELMTPIIREIMPLSKITLGYMEDLGYTVDYRNADPFSRPVNDGSAVFEVAGSLSVGHSVSAVIIAPDPEGSGNFEYRWQTSIDGVSWSQVGSSSSSYLIAPADQGKQLRLEVTYDDWEGFSERITTAIGRVPLASIGTSGFSISGHPKVGNTLSVQTSTDEPNDNKPFSFAWQTSSDGIAWNLVGSGSSYTIADSDQGKQLRLRVEYNNDLGTPEVDTLSAGIVPVLPPLAETRVAGMDKAKITELSTPEFATDVSLRQGDDDRPLRSIGINASSIDLGGPQSNQHNAVTVKAAVESTTADAQAIGLDSSELLLRPGDDSLLIEALATGNGPCVSIAIRNSFLSANRGDDTITLRGDLWGDRAIVFGGDGNDRITGHGIGRDSFLQAGSGDDWVSIGRLETTLAAAPLVSRDRRSLPVSTYRGGDGFDVLQLRETTQAAFDAEATWFTTGGESGWLFQGARFSGFERIMFG